MNDRLRLYRAMELLDLHAVSWLQDAAKIIDMTGRQDGSGPSPFAESLRREADGIREWFADLPTAVLDAYDAYRASEEKT